MAGYAHGCMHGRVCACMHAHACSPLLVGTMPELPPMHVPKKRINPVVLSIFACVHAHWGRM